MSGRKARQKRKETPRRDEGLELDQARRVVHLYGETLAAMMVDIDAMLEEGMNPDAAAMVLASDVVAAPFDRKDMAGLLGIAVMRLAIAKVELGALHQAGIEPRDSQ